MNHFLIVRLLGDRGMVFPETRGYGSVEIYPGGLDFPSETVLLKQSLNAFEEEVNLSLAQRIITVIEADNPMQADKEAEIRFNQVLDNLERDLRGLGIYSLLKSGFVKNIQTGWQSPRLPSLHSNKKYYPSFKMKHRVIEHIDANQALFIFNASELKLAIIRSNHWIRNSRNESNIQIKCLFIWFAIEAICKIGDENITGKLMKVLGFPLGKVGLYLSADTIQSIKNHPKYEFGKKYFEERFNELREFRNNSVHSGFRSWDITESNLQEYEEILWMTSTRLYSYAINALYQGLNNLKDLWEYFDLLYCERKDLIIDLHGNILYKFTLNLKRDPLYPARFIE